MGWQTDYTDGNFTLTEAELLYFWIILLQCARAMALQICVTERMILHVLYDVVFISHL